MSFNKLTLTAERMDSAITLNEFALKQNDQNLYAVKFNIFLKDAYLGIEKFAGFVDETV